MALALAYQAQEALIFELKHGAKWLSPGLREGARFHADLLSGMLDRQQVPDVAWIASAVWARAGPRSGVGGDEMPHRGQASQKAAEQAMPANAADGPAPAAGVVPLPEERRGKARQRLRGMYLV